MTNNSFAFILLPTLRGTNGQLEITDAAIALLFGNEIEGDHVLTLEEVGTDGRRRAMDRPFTRTSRAPNPFEIVSAVQSDGLRLGWTSAGSGVRYRVLRNIEGQSPLVITDGVSELATQINLPTGLSELFIEAYDHVGHKANSQTVLVQIG